MVESREEWWHLYNEMLACDTVVHTRFRALKLAEETNDSVLYELATQVGVANAEAIVDYAKQKMVDYKRAIRNMRRRNAYHGHIEQYDTLLSEFNQLTWDFSQHLAPNNLRNTYAYVDYSTSELLKLRREQEHELFPSKYSSFAPNFHPFRGMNTVPL